MRTPPRAWGIRAPTERGSKIPRGPWVGGCRRTPEGAFNATLFIDALQANGHRSPTVALPCCTHRALHRRAGTFRTPLGRASVPPDPTQLRAKAHFCDRHHIASAMAELAFCLSIIPHMRSFDVHSRLSPAHAGPFLRRSTQRGARDRHCVRPAAVRCARSLARACRSLRRRREWRASDTPRVGLSLLEALDHAGKLLVVLREVVTVRSAGPLCPSPVLRRGHQEI
jgi:hypothetical protein